MLLPYRTMDAGCTTHSVSITFDRERERFFSATPMDSIYVRCLRGEERKSSFHSERYEESSVTSKCQIGRITPQKILSASFVDSCRLSSLARYFLPYILANRVINKVNSAPLVSRQKTILARPKPRSNAPTDVSRPLNTINQPYSKRRKMRQRDTGGGERETRRDIRARRHVEWVSSVGQRTYHRPVESIYASRDEAYRGRSILDPFAQGVNPRGNWKLYGNEVLPSAGRNARRVGEQKDNTILLAGEFNRQMQAANDDEDDELVAACTGTGACTDTGGGDKQPHNVHAHSSFG